MEVLYSKLPCAKCHTGAKPQAESQYDIERVITYRIISTLSLITNLSHLKSLECWKRMILTSKTSKYALNCPKWFKHFVSAYADGCANDTQTSCSHWLGVDECVVTQLLTWYGIIQGERYLWCLRQVYVTLIYPAHFEDVQCQSGVNHIYEG